jgi:hypothetical protein
MGGAGLPVSTAVSFVFPTREIQTPRIFFKYRRRLLGELSRAAVKALSVYLEALAGERLVPGIANNRRLRGGGAVRFRIGAFPAGPAENRPRGTKAS